MIDLQAILAVSNASAPATLREVEAFEARHRVQLPAAYRTFILETANGGSFGPEYGQLPLGSVPAPWAPIHNYADRLTRPFPLTEEWVWEDEPDQASVAARIEAVDDGVLLLGEEGCGARWVLVLRGPGSGSVRLSTGEGATPSPASGFTEWLDQRVRGGFPWWSQLAAGWGPEPGIWFASHAIKQAFVIEVQRTGSPSPTLSQSAPLCADCRAFLARGAAYYQSSFSVTVPGLVWHFHLDESVTSTVTPNAGK